jgi:hypothetical protein
MSGNAAFQPFTLGGRLKAVSSRSIVQVAGRSRPIAVDRNDQTQLLADVGLTGITPIVDDRSNTKLTFISVR